jgi:L,D-transpeptidase catalytic domain
MRLRKFLQHGLIGATAVLVVGARFIPGVQQPGPAIADAATFVASMIPPNADATRADDNAILMKARTAVDAFADLVRPLSHRKALETAFRSYYAFRAEHPEKVTKPFLYFVDYGLPSTKPRGYVFDMNRLTVVEGPFTVAHGRGSSSARDGVPTRFSNRPGSAATSLGLYVAQETYRFSGKTGGRRYHSLGLRLMGVSGDYNDNARRRGVVAHGAPYVTASRAGRSEGCPAMEQTRAQRLLPRLAHGGLVFLFAPEKGWMSDDPWVMASTE